MCWVFSFGLCCVLFRVVFFLLSSLFSLVSDCIEIRFMNLFPTSYNGESRAKKTLKYSSVYRNWRSYKMMLQLFRFSQTLVCGNPNTQHYSLLVWCLYDSVSQWRPSISSPPSQHTGVNPAYALFYFFLSHLCFCLQLSWNSHVPCGCCLYTGSDDWAKAGHFHSELLLSQLILKMCRGFIFWGLAYIPSWRICPLAFSLSGSTPVGMFCITMESTSQTDD